MSQISPRVDIAFKKIFGVEENKDLLISLINAIVCESDKVCEITLLNPYNARDFKGDKLSILDIKAQGKDGKRFNVEIQIADEADYDSRALYYWAKLYTEQLSAGQPYRSLCKTIGIHILNFTSIPKMEKYHNVFHITEKETREPHFTDLELHTIELKKFTDIVREDLSDLLSKINTSLDMWVAFLTRHELLNKPDLPKPLNDPALKKALNVLDVMNLTLPERESYEERLKWLRMETSVLEKVEQESVVKGIEIGKVQGIEIGKAQALKEIAVELLVKRFDIDIISQITGLSLCEIELLKISNEETSLEFSD